MMSAEFIFNCKCIVLDEIMLYSKILDIHNFIF